MDFTKKTVRSRPGLTQEEALRSLQESPYFRTAGTKIASITHRADRWVAVLDIPKTAAPFPPGDEGGEPAPPKSEGSDESSDDDSDSSDSPDGGGESDSGAPKGEGGPPKSDKPGSDTEVVGLLTQILHALQGGPPMGGPGGPDDLGPGAELLGGPPPHGGPAGGPGAAPPKGPGAMGAGRPLKPGEVPNKPGVTPIGSPAFSHTRQANPYGDPMGGGMGMGGGPMSPGPNPMQPGATGMEPGPSSQGGTGACASCGGPLGPDGACPTCGGSYVAGLRQSIARLSGRSASASVTCPVGVTSVKQAKALIESAVGGTGYKIKQIKRTPDGRLAALLSVR